MQEFTIEKRAQNRVKLAQKNRAVFLKGSEEYINQIMVYKPDFIDVLGLKLDKVFDDAWMRVAGLLDESIKAQRKEIRRLTDYLPYINDRLGIDSFGYEVKFPATMPFSAEGSPGMWLGPSRITKKCSVLIGLNEMRDFLFEKYFSRAMLEGLDPIVFVLCHELVHQKQFIEARHVQIPGEYGVTLWEGEFYHDAMFSCHSDKPWEIEANQIGSMIAREIYKMEHK